MFVAVFVISIIRQVAGALFFPSEEEVATATPRTSAACSEGLSELLQAIDGTREAGRSDSDALPSAARHHPHFGAIEAECSKDPNGVDALAAVLRYERSAASAFRNAAELRSVRNRAASFISGAR